jgi:hypothetical protein
MGAEVAAAFRDVMGYEIWEGPSTDPAENFGTNLSTWLEGGGPMAAFDGAGRGSGWGPFGSYDQWANQFEQEHGRPPTSDDEGYNGGYPEEDKPWWYTHQQKGI